MGRIRAGEALAGAGAAALFALLFLDWFGVEVESADGQGALNQAIDRQARAFADQVAQSGWSSLGWFLAAMLAIVIALGVWLVVGTVIRVQAAGSVGTAVVLVVFGTFTLLVTLIRVVTQPDLGHDLPNAAVSVNAPAYLGLLALAAVVAGAWLTLADERLGAPESAYAPPPPRPAPSG